MNSSKKRRFSLGLAFILVCSLAAATLSGCGRFGSVTETYLIGHVARRSGPDRAEGVRLGEAIALVVEAFNHDEPNGIDNHRVTVIHGDAGSIPSGFAYQATRLFTINRVPALIGGVNVGQLEAMIPPTQTEDGLLISPACGLPSAPGKAIWPVGLHPTERGKYLAKFAAEQMKISNIAVVVDHSHALYPAIAGSFKSEFQHPERRIGPELTFRGDAELQALPAKILAAQPKAIIFCGKARDLLSLLSAIRKDPKSDALPVLFGGEEEEALFLNDAKDSQGVVYTTAFTSADKSESVQKFCSDFRSRTGQLPDVNAAMSADAMRILLAAGRKAKTLRHDSAAKDDPLLRELGSLETDSLTGPFWFAKDQVAMRTIYLMRIEAGAAVLQKQYAPEK